MTVTGKPTVEELGIDVAAQRWQRSGAGDGAIEVAMVTGAGPGAGDWVLMRVAGDPAERVLVYDRHEWECFLDGVRNGEFDDGAAADAVELRRQGVAGGRPSEPRPLFRELTYVIHNLGSCMLSATLCQGGDVR
jgi:hypothetical protein